jgi:hypothetical protein
MNSAWQLYHSHFAVNGTPTAFRKDRTERKAGKTQRAGNQKNSRRLIMKRLSVWLGVLILSLSMAVPVFAAQRQTWCIHQEKTENFRMRSQQEPLPWETPGGKVQSRTQTSLAE